MQPSTQLVHDLTDVVGESLRCVARYDRDGYHVQYVRPDVERRYSDEEVEALHHDFILQSIGADHVEGLFHAGDLHCSVFCFEHAHVLHFVRGESEGFLVSMDATVGRSIPTVLSRCRDEIEAAL